MRAMTEIEWLDGRVTKVPELALGDAFGESVQAELDFGFDDVLEGLWVEVRHHEPDEDSDGDPRGRGCALYADCRYSLWIGNTYLDDSGRDSPASLNSTGDM